MRMSAKEFRNRRKKKPKYRNKKTQVDGHVFDSRLESERYIQLRMMQDGGLIRELELQPSFTLLPKYKNGDGKSIRAMSYVADFKYKLPDGEVVIEDVKGVKTQVYRLKKKLFEHKYAPLTIKEITKVDI